MEGQIQEASNLNPLAIGLLLVLACLTLSLPRRLAFCPFLIMIGLMPMGQQIVVGGLHLHLFRIILLTGLLRIFVRGELRQLKLMDVDKVFIGWVIVSIVFGTLTKPSMDLFINRSGDAFNALGCYFFARCVIVNFEDVLLSIRTLAIISLPIAALMMVEKMTAHNLLSIFGGVSEITVIRDGHLRCQGAFRHPILAGAFGATQVPLFFGLWRHSPKNHLLPFMAMSASLVIVVTASSSGALMGLMAGIGGLGVWRWRRNMRLFRWGVFGLIIGLEIVMKPPVWYLLAKLGDVTGGTGWHRAWLIDQSIAHFDEWWLFGTTYTAHWGPSGEVTEADPNMMDITNHYIMEGVKGGVLKLGLFLAIIISCFQGIGQRLRVKAPNSPDEFFVWTLGVSLFAHCLSFISANYFDQTILIWYWLQASICCISNESLINSKANMACQSTVEDAKNFRYSVPLKAGGVQRLGSETFRFKRDRV